MIFNYLWHSNTASDKITYAYRTRRYRSAALFLNHCLCWSSVSVNGRLDGRITILDLLDSPVNGQLTFLSFPNPGLRNYKPSRDRIAPVSSLFSLWQRAVTFLAVCAPGAKLRLRLASPSHISSPPMFHFGIRQGSLWISRAL